MYTYVYQVALYVVNNWFMHNYALFTAYCPCTSIQLATHTLPHILLYTLAPPLLLPLHM